MTTPEYGTSHLAYWLQERRRRGAELPGFVYVIGAREAIKVGKALDVEKRMAELQTGNPFPLQILHILPGYTDLERELHRMLPLGSRLQGEWFGGPDIEGFLEFVGTLAEQMVADHQRQSNKRLVPHFRDYDPWKEWHEGRPASITPEQLQRVGRLSSANRSISHAPAVDTRWVLDKAHGGPAFSPHKPS